MRETERAGRHFARRCRIDQKNHPLEFPQENALPFARSYEDEIFASSEKNRQHTKKVSPTGFEPVTFGFGGRRAIQLCHGDLLLGIRISNRSSVVNRGSEGKKPSVDELRPTFSQRSARPKKFNTRLLYGKSIYFLAIWAAFTENNLKYRLVFLRSVFPKTLDTKRISFIFECFGR